VLNKFAKVLLTATAIAPVALTYSYVAVTEGRYMSAAALAGVCVGLVALCLWFLQYIRGELEEMQFRVTHVEAADRENIAFLLLYILPLFTAQFDDFNWKVIAPIIFIFAIVVGTGFNYHFNPLLGLMGWHFYKVGTEEGVSYVLITKKEVRNTRKPFKVAMLTEYIVMDIGEE